MPVLRNGDTFPALPVSTVGGGTISLPGDFAGSYGVVLTYRGAWCPLCVAQLSEFAAQKDALDEAGVKVVALSVDDEATSEALKEKLGLQFPVGYGADADAVAAAIGAFTNDTPHYLQPAAFVLDPSGTVLTSVYSTGSVGRLVASDAVRYVKFMKSKATPKAA